MDNIAIQNILTRTSIRNYLPDSEIPVKDIETILRAAMAAPTAVNRQPWQYIVVTDRLLLSGLADALPYAKMAARCAAAVIVCGDSSRFLDGEDATLWIQDLSASAENILLAAHALGYGAVWTSIYPHPERETPVRKLTSMPEGIVPFCLIPMGVPDRDHAPRDKWDETRIRFNKW